MNRLRATVVLAAAVWSTGVQGAPQGSSSTASSVLSDFNALVSGAGNSTSNITEGVG